MTGLTARTLQRHMATEGLSYTGLVDQVRFDLALQLFRDGGVTLGGVAKALGYTANSHFTRAFRRWTGFTPREFRNRRRALSASAAIMTPPPHPPVGRQANIRGPSRS